MKDNDYTKGIIFGIASVFFVSMQPIIANSRPPVIDAYIFATMSVIVMALVFLPFLLYHQSHLRKQIKINTEEKEALEISLNGWKSHLKLLIYIGINFGIAQIFFFIAYGLAGAISTSLAQQTSLIFALLFGYFINHDKVSKPQIIFSALLFFGLFLAITQGSFELITINLGIIIMIFTAALWMIAHALIRPVFQSGEITVYQLGFIRNVVAGIFLVSTYFIFYPLENINLLFDPVNILYFVLIGVFYGLDILCWYKCLSYIEISKASVVASPMPIVTAIFAFIFLGEIMTIYHLIGAIIIIFSIIMIVRVKKKDITDEES